RAFGSEAGPPEAPRAPPGAASAVTGGSGLIWGPPLRSESRRDAARTDLNLYSGSHEIKIGGDYDSSRTDGISSFSGGQRVEIRNERGQTYYHHSFFATSLTDPTPLARNPDPPRLQDHRADLPDSWTPAPARPTHPPHPRSP